MFESNISSNRKNPIDNHTFSLTHGKGFFPIPRANNAIADTALNIYDRNTYSNYNSEKPFQTTNNYFFQAKEKYKMNNNYLTPLVAINNEEKTTIDSDLINPRLYQTMRSKLNKPFSSLIRSKQVDINSFEQMKKDEIKFNPENENSVKKLDENIFYLNKNKRKTGVFVDEIQKYKRSKTSTASTDKDKESVKNPKTLYIVSRFQNWITVTPKSKNRKLPLEKQKEDKMQKTSKLLPDWMHLENKLVPLINPMKSKEYTSHRERKKKKFTMLVDKHNITQEKSIFSLGDFRHNVMTKETTESNMINLQRSPKCFNQWTNDDIYHPKFKRDVNEEKIENFKQQKEEANKKIEKKFKNKNEFKL